MRIKISLFLILLSCLSFGQYVNRAKYTTGYQFVGDAANNYLRFTTEVMSSSTWTYAVRLSTVTAASNNILMMGSAGTEGLYIRSANHLLSYRNSAGTLYPIGTGYNLDNGAYHTLIVRCDGTNMYVYVDGVYRGTDNHGGTLKARYLFTHNALTPKCNASGYDIRIWNTDIGDAEALKYNGNTMTITPNVCWLPLSEGGLQSVAYDISGSGNNCTYFGSNNRALYKSNVSNKTYGYTKVSYLGQVVEVPYNISGTSNYVSPVINAAEKTFEYPKTIFTNYNYVTDYTWTIYIVGGQSNASGFRQTSTMADSLKGNMGYVKIWTGATFDFINSDVINNNQWPLTSRLTGYGVDVNLWYIFNKQRNRTLVIKYAVNSTNLAVNWGAGVTGNTAQLATIINNAVAYLNSNNINYKWGGFIWYQGEADMGTEAYANAYQTNLGALVQTIRTATTPNLHAYIFNPNPSAMGYAYYATVRTAISNYCTSDINSSMIDVFGVSSDLHPDASKMQELAITLNDSIINNQ